MTPQAAYGLILASSLLTASVVWLACWRWWVPRRLEMHEGYLRGFAACSRIRDREEVQARKSALLNIGTTAQPRVVTEVKSSSGYDTHCETTSG